MLWLDRDYKHVNYYWLTAYTHVWMIKGFVSVYYALPEKQCIL